MWHNITRIIFKVLVSCMLVITVSACSEDGSAGNWLEGTWQLDRRGLDNNSVAYLKATQSAEFLTFTPTSAISGNMAMDVEYEPTDEGLLVIFEGMKIGTLYKMIDENTFEIRIIDVGRFRYIRQQPDAPEKIARK